MSRYVVKDAEGVKLSAFYSDRVGAEKALSSFSQGDLVWQPKPEQTWLDGLEVEEVQTVFLGFFGNRLSRIFDTYDKALEWRDREDERAGGFSEVWIMEKEVE